MLFRSSINLGTPSGITSTSTNSTNDTTHSHRLEDNAVTEPKLASNSVTSAKLSGISGVKLWGVVNSTGEIPLNTGSGGWTVDKFGTGQYKIYITNPIGFDTYCLLVTAVDTSGANEFAVIKNKGSNPNAAVGQRQWFTVYIKNDTNNLSNSQFSFIILY